MDRHELAWAAGFFDGEGWAAPVRFGRGQQRRPQAQINQSDDDDVPEALVRFRAAVGGAGNIGGPHRKAGRKDRYWWVAASRADVERVGRVLDPWLGDVKRRAFDRVIDRPGVPSPSPDRSDEWVAWAAGLYDGEGSSSLLKHRTHAGYRVPELSITQSSADGRPEVLVRFAAIVQAGHIDGPHSQEPPWDPVYRWKCGAIQDVGRVVSSLWPWLSSPKRIQAQAMLDLLDAQPKLPRGNPAWGSNKTHCINGHEYASARVRPWVSRGKGIERRVNKQCLVCSREQARARRLEEKRTAADDGRRPLEEPGSRYLLK